MLLYIKFSSPLTFEMWIAFLSFARHTMAHNEFIWKCAKSIHGSLIHIFMKKTSFLFQNIYLIYDNWPIIYYYIIISIVQINGNSKGKGGGKISLFLRIYYLHTIKSNTFFAFYTIWILIAWGGKEMSQKKKHLINIKLYDIFFM